MQGITTWVYSNIALFQQGDYYSLGAWYKAVIKKKKHFGQLLKHQN